MFIPSESDVLFFFFYLCKLCILSPTITLYYFHRYAHGPAISPARHGFLHGFLYLSNDRYNSSMAVISLVPQSSKYWQILNFI